MFFHEEVQACPAIKDVKVSPKELELAETLINQLTHKFDISAFKDEYNERVKAAIKKKISGGEIVAPHKASNTKIINIMEALKKSLKGANIKTKKKDIGKKIQKSKQNCHHKNKNAVHYKN